MLRAAAVLVLRRQLDPTESKIFGPGDSHVSRF
jgi:hypothetical protein